MIHPLRVPTFAPPEPRVVQETGTVAEVSGGTAAVQTPRGLCTARRAVSCLVEPEVGDRVLLAVEDGDEGDAGKAWVLAVLSRKAGAAVRLGAEGDVSLHLPRGRFAVAAGQGIDLATAGDAVVAAGALRVTASAAELSLDQVSFLGRLVKAQVETVKLVASALDQTLERFWHRVKRSYRFVEEQDHVRAGNLDYSARETAQVRGKNALVTAEQLVKVDGGQVHLG